ncbi:histidine phosphatase family protein [Actinomyces sp. B33]|uniref:histidine phosphatase family protein n=1 Tax=Actinomyces sp. B33 TaxID=2942131 RepID=UPI0023423B3F|nr:histidine phosphatase family protein [Actinomyces sp. B33]MDC4233529.1 histidine phosphatase family protein [Actinomyces sp. B33]
METTTIHVMRHGEVDNPAGVLYGRLPGFALTELGVAMAHRAAEYLTGIGADIADVTASPLLRARMTAAPTARAYGLDIGSDARLIEADNVFEGMAINADRSILVRPCAWRNYGNPFKPSWGEPYADIASRMSAAVSAALRRARGREALLVSHQNPITTLTRFARRQSLAHMPWAHHCALASITSFRFAGATLVGIDYAEPAADLVARAKDMTPGRTAAAVKR